MRTLHLLCTVSAVALFSTGTATADTYTVSNTLDTGPGSFRQAILDANGHAGADTIANGLILGAGSDGCIIKGLVINRFAGNGIVVQSNSNTIAGNFIGTNASGTGAFGQCGLHGGIARAEQQHRHWPSRSVRPGRRGQLKTSEH